MNPILILGSGLAGWSVARELRARDAQTPITVVSADNGDFYAKPALSNAWAQRRGPAQLITTAGPEMAHKLGVRLLSRTPVHAIEPTAQRVITAQGPLTYQRLVLATGAQPIRLPLGGTAAQRVMAVNNLQDFSAFHASLDCDSSSFYRSNHVLIMGAGLIGCEFANDLATTGSAVSVVDPGPYPMAALLPPGLGLALQAALATRGVQWHLGHTVQRIDALNEAPDGPVQALRDDGLRIQADRVLSAVGLRPDTTLARAAGLVCERGVVVDACLQTSAPGVYALGDVAQYADGLTRPYVAPILHGAKALAATLSGRVTPVHFAPTPVIVKTPALPLCVLPPPPGAAGQWQAHDALRWAFVAPDGQRMGFALGGAATAERNTWLASLAGCPA
ncbi:MAG: rubredoxin-NAD(+) reductase AlkT [Rhodoferax sp.]